MANLVGYITLRRRFVRDVKLRWLSLASSAHPFKKSDLAADCSQRPLCHPADAAWRVPVVMAVPRAVWFAVVVPHRYLGLRRASLASKHNETALWELARAAFENTPSPFTEEVLFARDRAVVSQLLVRAALVALVCCIDTIFNHAASCTLRASSILYCMCEVFLIEILRGVPLLLHVRRAATNSTATVCGCEAQWFFTSLPFRASSADNTYVLSHLRPVALHIRREKTLQPQPLTDITCNNRLCECMTQDASAALTCKVLSFLRSLRPK